MRSALPRPSAPPTATASTKGILRPQVSAQYIDLRRYPVSAQTQPFAERYWAVHWNVRDQSTHEVQLIPHPCVNITFLPGIGAQVHGVGSRTSTHPLSGSGTVFGVKFRPGGFTAVTGVRAASLTDRSVPMHEVFGAAASSLTTEVLATSDDEHRVQLVDEFLRHRLPPTADDAYDLVLQMVTTMLDDRSITRVNQIAAQYDVSVRTVQRLFHRYVGVGPKWVIRRYRMHDAAELLAAGDVTDPAVMAMQLGWFDQAHFASDFRRLVGMTPGEYATACAAGVDHVVDPRSESAGFDA